MKITRRKFAMASAASAAIRKAAAQERNNTGIPRFSGELSKVKVPFSVEPATQFKA